MSKKCLSQGCNKWSFKEGYCRDHQGQAPPPKPKVADATSKPKPNERPGYFPPASLDEMPRRPQHIVYGEEMFGPSFNEKNEAMWLLDVVRHKLHKGTLDANEADEKGVVPLDRALALHSDAVLVQKLIDAKANLPRNCVLTALYHGCVPAVVDVLLEAKGDLNAHQGPGFNVFHVLAEQDWAAKERMSLAEHLFKVGHAQDIEWKLAERTTVSEPGPDCWRLPAHKAAQHHSSELERFYDAQAEQFRAGLRVMLTPFISVVVVQDLVWSYADLYTVYVQWK